jgi:hypothetical protein
MSHKISIKEKKEWLALFEQGLTENQVAKKVKRDLRTIVAGLREASAERHLVNAEAEMLRNALFKHQNKLTDVLNNISYMLVLPVSIPELHEDENNMLQPVPITGALLEMNAAQELILKIHDEDKLEWELLQAHLKSDDLWKYLKRWREAVIDYYQACWQFKKSIKVQLKEETGLVFKEHNNKTVEYLTPATIELFYEVAMRKLLGIKDSTNLEESILAEDNGRVIHNGNELARCRKTAECRDKILSVFKSLTNTIANPQAGKVKNTHTALSEIAKKARRQVDELLSLGMITGKCRVCTRLGK